MTSIVFGSKTFWLREHKDNVIATSTVGKNKYCWLFHKYVNRQIQGKELSQLHFFYEHFANKKPKFLIRKLKGPCYGTSMALFETQLKKNPEAIKDLVKSETFLERALYFSLLEIVRCKMVKKKAKNPTIVQDKEYKQLRGLIGGLEPGNRTTLKSIPQQPREAFLQDILNEITTRDESGILVSTWSQSSYFQTLQKRKDKWVTPHCLFIFLSSSQGKFYFYDSELKKVVSAHTLEEFKLLFADFIRKLRRDYLCPNVLWRIESSEITN